MRTIRPYHGRCNDREVAALRALAKMAPKQSAPSRWPPANGIAGRVKGKARSR